MTFPTLPTHPIEYHVLFSDSKLKSVLSRNTFDNDIVIKEKSQTILAELKT
jgi:hypothetical protein